MPSPSSAEPLPIAVLISGSGGTLMNLVGERDAGRLAIDIRLVVADRECTGLARAREAGLSAELIQRRDFPTLRAFSEAIFTQARAAGVKLVVLGGFLARIEIPADFGGRVMNIHPALIPAFCGKGMYGHHVHEAVLGRGCKVSGCTVHFCDNRYDEGPIILQRAVPVLEGDTPDTLQQRVFAEECRAYPEAIRLFAAGRLTIRGRSVAVAE